MSSNKLSSINHFDDWFVIFGLMTGLLHRYEFLIIKKNVGCSYNYLRLTTSFLHTHIIIQIRYQKVLLLLKSDYEFFKWI